MGQITDMSPADKSEIAKLIQRGRAVTDDQLATRALAYARFCRRVYSVFGLIFLVLAAGEAVTSALGSGNARIPYAVTSGGLLLVSLGWFYQADCCRRGAQATAQARAGRQ